MIAALALIAAAAAWRYLLPEGPSLAAEGLRRELSEYRVVQRPAGVPEAWWHELEEALGRAPAVSLADRAAAAAAREVLLGVSWIDPASIRAALALPEGVRAVFRPFRPLLRAVRDGQVEGLLGPGGVLLEAAGPAEFLQDLPMVLLADEEPVPRPGRRTTDPVAQEALAALPEFLALRGPLEKDYGLRLEGMARSPDFPAGAAVRPSLVFFTASGREIVWGQARDAGNPLDPGPKAKALRLRAFLEKYPRLEGTRRIYLDRPVLRALDDDFAPLPVPEDPA